MHCCPMSRTLNKLAFTSSQSKREAAIALGADEVALSRNAEEMAKHAKSFDLILNTVAAQHDLDAFLVLLKRDVKYRFVIDNATLAG